MRYLSVCSGIEAATVAWHSLGWTPVAFSEIEKFPCAVLAHRYPGVPNLGDLTMMDVGPLGSVDILVGGTPCQAFSVAGLRQSLDDARGNLTLSYVRLAHELVQDHGLRNAVWENVPGVLSTKDNAFGCFLGALVGSDDALIPSPKPPDGKSDAHWKWSKGKHSLKWPNAGMVSGPKGRSAWRILDAQYFGLAQRRRRVFVVTDFGNGADPAAVLFELEGVLGNPAPSREARKDIAPAISARTKGGGGLGADFDLDGGLIESKWPAEIASTLNAHYGDKWGLEDQHALGGAALFVPAVSVTGEISHTLKAEGFDASEDGTGRGNPIIAFSSKDYGADAGELSPTLRAGRHSESNANAGVPPAIVQTVALRGRDGGATAELGGEVATALRASQGGGDKPHVLTSAVRRLTPVECERLQGFPDDYTRIPMPKSGKKVGPVWAADGPRYKALGNSMAVPVMRWIGERIDRFMPPAKENTVSFCFMDFETQSNLDLTITGTLKYVLDTSTRVLLLSWAVDDEPVKLWCPELSSELEPEVWSYVKGRMASVGPCPVEITKFCARPGNYLVASNMAFDRQVWQQVAAADNGFPRIEIEQTLCSQAQAQASNLPGSLDFAGRALGLGTKTLGGKAIMKRFADRALPLPGARVEIDAALDRAAAIRTAIAAWELYLDYGVQDTELMRDVWRCTRPLDAEEWRNYWTSERINDRGMLADLEVCRGAMAYREEEAQHVVEQVKEITNGQIAGPTFTAQINAWLYERLPDDLREFMVKARDEETGEATRLTGAKDVMTRLLEEIEASDSPPADEVIDLIEVLQFGRASSAVKFEKIYNQAVTDDTPGANREVGRLCGSYVFNGAGQTGRFSSRGVQVHNLPRAFLKNELDVLDMVANRVPIAELRKIGPVPAVLSKLIRPAFIAPQGKLLVWGDWAAIEARVNPWLADTRDADAAVLAPFRACDADPNVPDIYILNAAVIFNIPADVLWERYKNGDPEAKGMRQAGKIAVLALGFLGSVGALRTMARGYGMRLSNEEARIIVDGWRDRNKWARKFGDKAEAAAFSAMAHPGNVYPAGRLRYQYAPDLMGGTLACFLPDGRPIVYPKAKIVKLEKFGKMTDTITYLHGMGRRSLWNGLQIQGGTQATAASILRSTLDRLETEETEAEIVLHTHDEVGGEVDEAKAGAFAERLEAAMVRGFDWSEGLPLAAEVSTSWFYTKAA